jgi:methionyl aminopeptidase
MIEIKSKREVELMRSAGMVVAETLYVLCKATEPGITTAELNELAGKTIAEYGAESAFLNYSVDDNRVPYPGIVCISVNEEIVHGIPGPRKIESGDIVSFDVGTRLDGFCGDGAGTVIVGDVPKEVRKLVDVTRQSLYNGIEQADVGNRIRDIGRAVQVTAESAGFGVVREMVGHGIGKEVHEEPQVPNFVIGGFSPKLVPGITIAIEPMITMGDWHLKELNDKWTLVTVDGSLSAHFEHTVAVTEDGPLILTLRKNGKAGFDLN